MDRVRQFNTGEGAIQLGVVNGDVIIYQCPHAANCGTSTNTNTGTVMTKFKRILIVAAAAVAATAPAWAINKCIGPDGKASFQDAPCASSTKASEVKVRDAAPDGEAWEFAKTKDSMTGRETCAAISPPAYVFPNTVAGKAAIVRMQIAVSKPANVSMIVATPPGSTELFHPDTAGTGVKVDGNAFVPVTSKLNANAVGFSDATVTALNQQLLAGKELRMRLRFWPYEKLHDTDAVSLRGFKQAMTSALACAK